jgi:hypothetical protein
MDLPKSKKISKLKKRKPPGGGAAARQRQFDQERGLEDATAQSDAHAETSAPDNTKNCEEKDA